MYFLRCFTAKTYTSSMSTLGAINVRLPLTYLRKKRLYEPIIRNCRPQHLGNTETNTLRVNAVHCL